MICCQFKVPHVYGQIRDAEMNEQVNAEQIKLITIHWTIIRTNLHF